jgi:hypothetical protein
MGPVAELGPLDAQIEHPDREGKWISALDAAAALTHMAEMACDLALAIGPRVMDITGLPRAETLHEMFHFLAALLEPAVSKLDPQLIHHAMNDLRVAQEYAIRLLHARNERRRHGKIDEDPEKLASDLVSAYPEHGFVISRDEARRLGLVVGDAENHPRWPKLKSLNTLIYTQGKPTFLEVFEDWELDSDENQEEEENHEAEKRSDSTDRDPESHSPPQDSNVDQG